MKKTKFKVSNINNGNTFYVWAYFLDEIESLLCIFDNSYDWDITW